MSDDLAPVEQPPIVTAEQRAALVDLLAAEPGIGTVAALRRVGVEGTKGQLRALVKQDDNLAEELHEARGKKLREELMSRAVDGYEDPIIGKDGDIVGYRTVKSDRLLEFACRMYLPEAKALRGVEVTGRDGGPVEVANPDVAAAIDRFTANIARLARGSEPGEAVREPAAAAAALPTAAARD